MPIRAATVTVTPATTYQTIAGWEAHAQSGDLSPNFAMWANTLFDEAVNDLGINRLRVEIVSGQENPVDAFSRWRTGTIPQSAWLAARYTPVNDNADPFSTNIAGFQFTLLDHRFDCCVLPMRQRLQARGERLYVNLNYVDFATTPFEHFTNPQEYAELMLVTFQHLQHRYGFVPDAIEVILEPGNANNFGWTGPIIGQVIAATGQRLAAAGFHPEFIAPSHTNQTTAITFFDQLMKVSGVRTYLREFSYHLYGGVSDANRTTIATRGAQYGLRTSMLEHVGSGYEDLHRDLKLANVSPW
jgi:O-glycosyl hydrolase